MSKVQFLIEIDTTNPDHNYVARTIMACVGNNFRVTKVVPLGYQRVFDAISAATCVRWGAAVGISVEKFLNALKS